MNDLYKKIKVEALISLVFVLVALFSLFVMFTTNSLAIFSISFFIMLIFALLASIVIDKAVSDYHIYLTKRRKDG